MTGRGGLDGWEAWLDTLDEKFRIVNGEVVSDFDTPLSIPLHECRDVAGILHCAARMRSALLTNSSYLPHAYLIKRFIRLAINAHRLSIPEAEIIGQLPKEWKVNIYS